MLGFLASLFNKVKLLKFFIEHSFEILLETIV